MIMPEQHHLLAQRGLGPEHPPEPPALSFDAILPVGFLEFLQPLAAEPVGLLCRHVAGFPAHPAHLFHPRPLIRQGRLRFRPRGRRKGIDGFRRREQGLDRLTTTEGMQRLDLIRRSTEARSAEQVRGFEDRP